MTVLQTVARQVRGPLNVNIPERNIPVGMREIKITVNSFAWPSPGVKVGAITFDFSFNNGVTWSAGFEMTFFGGQISYKGNPDAPRSLAYTLQQVADANTKVRGNVSLLTALDCSAVLEAF